MSIDTKTAFQNLKSFLIDAGHYAADVQGEVHVTLKDGKDALTETDLAVSKMAYERLAPWLSQEGHVLIDEETINTIGTPEEVFAHSRYQWILDPIDGTAGYAMGRDHWGVMLALLEDGRPLMGGIYMAAAGKAVFADDQKAWGFDRMFDVRGQRDLPLCARVQPVISQTFVESYKGSRLSWESGFTDTKAWVNTPESAAQGFYSTLCGQSAGASIFKKYGLWDFAAAFAVGSRTGFGMFAMKDGRAIDRITGDMLGPDWRFKEHYVFCHPDMTKTLSDALMM